MAKGNMLLGLSRGSVGDLTFYRRNDQQITSVRVRKVKNPQTNAQMYQRAINRTAVEAYGVLKSICDHSFEGVSYGANSYSFFLSRNMQMLRDEASRPGNAQKSYNPKDIKGIAAMPFLISSGSLPSIPFTLAEGEMDINLPAPSVAELQNATYQDIISKWGLQQGDQVTFLFIPTPTSGNFPDEPFGRDLLVARVILDPSAGDVAETQFFSPVAGAANQFGVNSPNVRNSGTIRFYFAENAIRAKVLSAGYENDYGIFGAAVIVSRQRADGSWLRSQEVLVYDLNFRENGYTLKQASTLTPTDLYVESDYYLNNAE